MRERHIQFERTLFVRKRRRYGGINFLADICLVALTGGLWLVWIFVREMRDR